MIRRAAEPARRPRAPRRAAPRSRPAARSTRRPRPITQPPRSPRLAALWVLVALAVVTVAAAFVDAPESVVAERVAQEQPVVRTTLVCPYVGGEPRAKSHVGVLATADATAPPAAPVEPVVVRELGAQAKTNDLLSVSSLGTVAAAEVKTAEPAGFAVGAVGPLAPGLVAEQTLLAAGPDFRGLSSANCAAAGREHWFVGGSGEVGRRGRLVLSNPTSVPAVVDVTVWGESGPVDAPGTRDIAIPAQGQQLLLMDALAPSARQVAVRVEAVQGRVAAALEIRETDELAPHGVSFVPPAAPPAIDVVVPGVPAHGDRTLSILAPGDSDAIVTLQLLGAEGPFSPVDADVVTVPAGTAAQVPIGAAAGPSAVSVRLHSDVPVTAAVRVADRPEGKTPEIAFTAAAEPLDGPAAAVLGRSGSGLWTRLLVSGVGEVPARVQLRTLAADGTPAADQTLDVQGGSTVAVDVKPPPEGPWTTVVVEPAQPGTVVVTREIAGSDSDGALLDLLPLVAPVRSVQVPEVAGELPIDLPAAGPITR